MTLDSSLALDSGDEFNVEWDMVVTGYGTSTTHDATLFAVGTEYKLKVRALDWAETSCNDQSSHHYILEGT